MIIPLKNLIRQTLPRSVLDAMIRHKRGHYSGPYPSWEAATARAGGYNATTILEKVTSATREVTAGRAAFERDSVTFPDAELDPLIIRAISRISAAGGCIRILDFGGSLGSSYYQHRHAIRDGVSVEWNIVEQSHYVERGLSEFSTRELRFHTTIESALKVGPPDIVLLSSVLQYLETPWEILTKLCSLQASIWIISRTPFHAESHDRVVVQHVPRRIYPASYPAWIFSRPRFVTTCRELNLDLEWHETPEGIVIDRNLRFEFCTALGSRI